MSLDQNVIPGVLAALTSVVGGPASGQPTAPGKLSSVHLGEQFRVTGRGPVAWVMGGNFTEPEPGATSLEETAWVVEVRLLCQFAPDQRHADEVLQACIEPIRQAFRSHRKLMWASAPGTGRQVNYPTSYITRARVSGGSWLYIAVNGVMYRMVVLTVLVGEKVGQTYSVGG